MQPREKILAGLVAILVVAYGGNWIFAKMLRGPLEERRAKVAALKEEIQDKQLELARARQAGKQLTEWRELSLPADVPMARTLYQGWLVQQITEHEFDKPNVDAGDAVEKRGIYQRLPFTVRGEVELARLTDFLYEFYRAGHLHQIQRIGLTPLEDGQRLDVSMTIEALVLPGTSRTEELNDGVSNRLAYASRNNYDAIVERNIFARYGAGQVSPADQAFLTAILDVDEQPQAWITLRASGEVLKLRPGDPLTVGRLSGHVVAIDRPDVVLSINDQRWLLTLGEPLSQADALPPEF